MEIGSVEQEVGVGGVWAIAQVKAEEHWQEVRRAGKRVGFDSRINCVECQPVIEEKNICKVEGKKPWRPIGSGEIMVDSAAEESVCPKTLEGGIPDAEAVDVVEVCERERGGQMGHYGEKTATLRAGRGLVFSSFLVFSFFLCFSCFFV